MHLRLPSAALLTEDLMTDVNISKARPGLSGKVVVRPVHGKRDAVIVIIHRWGQGLVTQKVSA